MFLGEIMRIKEWIKNQIALIKDKYKIQKSRFKDQYFGEVSSYDFRKVACKDAEIYDMMMSQNQYKAISEAEFLERFLLNQSKKDQFLEEAISNHNLRGIIFWELTKHMQIEGEKVTIL